MSVLTSVTETAKLITDYNMQKCEYIILLQQNEMKYMGQRQIKTIKSNTALQMFSYSTMCSVSFIFSEQNNNDCRAFLP